MTQWFLKIYDVLSRRRPWVAGVVCALALLCGVLALRMDYDEDIAAFMPLDEDARKYSEVFSSLGGQNRIAVVFRGRADDRIGVENAMDCFGQAVQRRDTARWVRRLQVRVDESALMDVMRQLWQDYPSLLTADDYRRLDSLLADDAYPAAQMERNRQLLMLPTGAILAQGLPDDPLQLTPALLARLRGLNVGDAYQVVDGYLFRDSVGIALLESPFGISESRDNARLQELLDSCMSDVQAVCPEVRVSAVGAPLIAVTNATQIKRDSLLAVGLAVVLILSVLLYAFRRVGDLVWIGVSVLAGWLFALGAMAVLRDGLSLIVVGIGSVIIGIAVNYPLHSQRFPLPGAAGCAGHARLGMVRLADAGGDHPFRAGLPAGVPAPPEGGVAACRCVLALQAVEPATRKESGAMDVGRRSRADAVLCLAQPGHFAAY